MILGLSRNTHLINAYVYLYYSEAYEDEHPYDYANFEEDDLTKRRRRNQEARTQGNSENIVLEAIQNPYYGVQNTAKELQTNNHVQNIKVTQNPYYGVQTTGLELQTNNHQIQNVKVTQNPYYE